jgi:hypothetical protein
MDIMQEIQNSQSEIMHKIDSVFAALIQKLENGEVTGENISAQSYETTYPIMINPAIFKGKKPTALIFGDEQVELRTWKMVAEEILKRCNNDPEKHVALMNLRGRLSGRERVFLAKESANMLSPKKIDANLYMETNYDAETLMRILTTRILGAVDYDCTGISVTVRTVARRG